MQLLCSCPCGNLSRFFASLYFANSDRWCFYYCGDLAARTFLKPFLNKTAVVKSFVWQFIAHNAPDLWPSLSLLLSLSAVYLQPRCLFMQNVCFSNTCISWVLLQVTEEQWDSSVVWFCFFRILRTTETVSIVVLVLLSASSKCTVHIQLVWSLFWVYLHSLFMCFCIQCVYNCEHWNHSE